MKQMHPAEIFIRNLFRWAGWSLPPAPVLPPRPWHPDGDAAFSAVPQRKVEKSAAHIAHMKAASGRFVFDSGSAVPESDGVIRGIRTNLATDKDPSFVVSRDAGPWKLWVKTGYTAPYGLKVRIPADAIPQGYPMKNYADHKMHIVDVASRVVIEIQFCEELTGLFGPGQQAYSCHGVKVYSLDVPSTDPTVLGSSAARIPLAETSGRFDDLMGPRPFVRALTLGCPAAHKSEFVAPATGTDGPSSDPDAIRMGMVLRLHPEDYSALMAKSSTGPQSRAVLRCLAGPGLIVVDTSANTTFGVEPDARWNPKDLATIKALTLDQFDVYQH